MFGYVAYDQSSFFSLCNLFRGRGFVRETSGCSIVEQVAMFLHIVGHNKRFRVVHQSFRRSIEIVSRVFHQVLYAVGELRNEMIKPPTTATHPKSWVAKDGIHICRYLLIMFICLGFNQLLFLHLSTILHISRTMLVPLMVHMCWQGCLDTCSRLSGVGNTTPHKMWWLLWTLISSSPMS